ncbi:MAG: hypothetical protein J6Y90_05550 [Lachnospiraceae bacterium]|nr:hypothetical protein [Lachnospiraceae bacterium]
MWFTKLLVDLVVVIAILASIPKLMGTMIDLARKLANSVNGMLRRLFKLDDPKAWETKDPKDFRDEIY